MEDKIDFSLGLWTLGDLALVKSATMLWDSDHIKKEIFKHKVRYDWRHKVENMVVVKSQELIIPHTVREKLRIYINAIGSELHDWMTYFTLIYGIRLSDSLIHEFSTKLRWTQYGQIDRREMAKILIEDTRIFVVLRYEIACRFCLEERINSLWNEINPSEFLDKDLNLIEEEEDALTSFWSYKIGGQFPANHAQASFDYAFEIAATNVTVQNEYAAKHFWYKMSSEERAQTLSRVRGIAYGTYGISTICFLLTHMQREQQLEVIRSCPLYFLVHFVLHPWRQLFFKTLSLTLDVVDNQDIFILLQKILTRDCPKSISHEIWAKILPSQFKYFVTSVKGLNLIKRLVSEGKFVLVKKIFKQVETEEEKRVIVNRLRSVIEQDRDIDNLIEVIQQCLEDGCEKEELVTELQVETCEKRNMHTLAISPYVFYLQQLEEQLNQGF